MRDQILGLLEKVDLALAASSGVIPPASLDPLLEIGREMRDRLAYPETLVVAGLVGGTGSGKSSLFNALAGEELSAVGGIRPTTTEPMALVSAAGAQALAGFLDSLSIEKRAVTRALDGVCLIDLPDTDSVVVDHRHTVEALLGRLDLMIWVFDPEKYRDSSIHDRIASLASRSDQFVFVLNQVDRVAGSALGEIEEDLAAALHDDGIASPALVLVAANPPAGPPQGIEALANALLSGDIPGRVFDKLVADLTEVSAALAKSTAGATALDFEARWSTAMAKVEESLARGQVADAAHVISGAVSAMGRDAGGETGVALADLSREVVGVLPALPAASELVPAARRQWWRRDRPEPAAETSQPESLAALADKIGSAARELVLRRARCHAAIADLHLSVSELTRAAPVRPES